LKLPMTLSPASFLTMMNSSPAAGINPPNDDTLSVAAALIVTEPATLSWSYFPAPLPGELPPTSTANVEVLANDVLPTTLNVPGDVPGATVPPLATKTEPATEPVPPRVATLLTV